MFSHLLCLHHTHTRTRAHACTRTHTHTRITSCVPQHVCPTARQQARHCGPSEQFHPPGATRKRLPGAKSWESVNNCKAGLLFFGNSVCPGIRAQTDERVTEQLDAEWTDLDCDGNPEDGQPAWAVMTAEGWSRQAWRDRKAPSERRGRGQGQGDGGRLGAARKTATPLAAVCHRALLRRHRQVLRQAGEGTAGNADVSPTALGSTRPLSETNLN